MTAAYHHTGVFCNKESYDRIRSLLVFSSEFLHFRRTEFSTDAAVTRIELLTWIQIEISSSNNDLLSVQPKVGECHSIQKNL